MLERFVGERLPLYLWKNLAFATGQDLAKKEVF